MYTEHIFLHLSAAGHGGWFHDSAVVARAEVDMDVQIPAVLTWRHRGHVAGPQSGSSLRSLRSLHASSQSASYLASELGDAWVRARSKASPELAAQKGPGSSGSEA